MNEFVEAVAGFEELLNLRNIENAAKPKQRLRDTRKHIETVYRNMINHINAAATLDTTDTYTEFINRLTANVDVIPVQQFSRKAIMPIPTVHLNGVELVFAKDFNLTYKNNIQPGVAEMNIVGKGNYAGKKNVTFNIE